MNYRVLYRKYRPDNFDNLVGQDAIKRILKNSIVNNKISHAYIFSGPRGTGKTSTARILAKAVNCLDNKTGEPCEKCLNCQNFSTSPDIIEIDAASNNGVDEIRELINNVKLMPTSSKYKVYIIDEVHMLSPSAFNALLLTLEEPPKHVIFILATTNIEKVPITILSRCQKFEFSRITEDLLVQHLEDVCKAENIKYELDGLKEIATLADGGMRDALSMLDQLSKENKEISFDFVSKEIGSISIKSVENIFSAIDKNDYDEIIKILNEFKNRNLNYKVVIKRFVDVLSLKAIDIMKNQKDYRLTYDDVKSLVFELNECLNKININVDPYTLIELIILSYVNLKENNVKKEIIDNEVSDNNLSNNVENIENLQEKNESKNNINNNFIDIRINNCFVGASKEALLNLKDQWTDFINKTTDSKVKGIILDLEPVAASSDYAILTTSIKHNVQNANEIIEDIEKSFKKLFKENYKFIVISLEKWEKEKKDYVINLKNKKEYKLIDENNVDDIKNKNDKDLESLATNLFDINKIEVQ